MNDDDVPHLIRAGGDDAVRAYREFLDVPTLSTNTRRVYRSHVRQFCRWAEARRLPLTLIAASDIAAYIEPFSSHATYDAVSILRRLFAHLVAAGFLTENPWGRRGRPRAGKHPAFGSADRFAWELRALHRELMADLDERYGDDPAFQLIKSIDRELMAMRGAAGDQAAGPQDAPDER
jgi:hypothetical protein